MDAPKWVREANLSNPPAMAPRARAERGALLAPGFTSAFRGDQRCQYQANVVDPIALAISLSRRLPRAIPLIL